MIDPRAAVEAIWQYLISVKTVRLASGNVEQFDPAKIEISVQAAFNAADISPEHSTPLIQNVIRHVAHLPHETYDGHTVPSTQEVRDLVVAALSDCGLDQVANT